MNFSCNRHNRFSLSGFVKIGNENHFMKEISNTNLSLSGEFMDCEYLKILVNLIDFNNFVKDSKIIKLHQERSVEAIIKKEIRIRNFSNQDQSCFVIKQQFFSPMTNNNKSKFAIYLAFQILSFFKNIYRSNFTAFGHFRDEK